MTTVQFDQLIVNAAISCGITSKPNVVYSRGIISDN